MTAARRSRQTTIAPSAPIEAASVGAATPPMIEPSTATTSPIGGSTTREQLASKFAAASSSRSSCGTAGTICGRTMPSTEQVDDVDRRQHQAGNHRGCEQRADREVEDVGEQDQDQARRDDLAERARGADDAAGEPVVVAAPQQCRQRQQSERHDRGADDAGGGAHQHAHQDDADAKPAAQAAGERARSRPSGLRPVAISRASRP